jgi:hypothetical protein
MALPEYRYGTCTNRTAKHFVLRRQAEPFPTECPDCGANIAAKRAIRPEFGFVCADERERIGSRPPKLRYPGEAEVLRFSDSPQSRTIDTPIGCVELLWGKRAELALIGEGEGTRGWWICTGCGRGIPCRATQHPPKSHKVPITGRDCTGTMGRRRFIHTFETDIVAITLPGDPLAPLESALAAIVAGASDTLEVPIDDIGGTLRVTGDRRQAVVYDTVPGGAGNAMQIAQQFELVVANAIDRVEGCNCGIDASCYACLKNHQNQRHHEDLTRKAALARLEPLELTAPSGTSGQTPVYDDPRFAALPPAWREAIELADPAAHDVLLLLAGTGIDAPEVGLELLDGRIVAELAWEPQRVAVVLADQHDAIGGWSEHGWSMFTTAQAEEILSAVRPESD